MNVKLISHTPDALVLLLRTKGTRLGHDDNPALWPMERQLEELAYMRDTIKSSWEFVDYTFLIEGVTRAFTHQLVRTRTGSYAQQTMRGVDVRENEVLAPSSVNQELWNNAVNGVMEAYAEMVDLGAPMQDARGILPTNVTTNIIAKFSLRTLHEMAKVRLCVRTQGEYQNVFRAMRSRVMEVHPWAEDFLEVHCVCTGTCAFPRYGKTECPVYLPEMDNSGVRSRAKQLFWSVRGEANPVAKEGRTM